MIGLSLEQANARLKDVDSLNDILDILKEIDISSRGKTTVLYSGIDRKIQTNLYDTLNSFKRNDNFRMIDKTTAAKFLTINGEEANHILLEAIEKIFKKEYPNFNIKEDLIKKDGSLVRNFIYGTCNGAWDTVSRRFASVTNGEIIILIGNNALTNRTFYQTEFPEIIKNENITKINGMDKLEFISKLNANDTDVNKLNYLKDNSKEYCINNITKNNNISSFDIVEEFLATIKEENSGVSVSEDVLDYILQNNYNESMSHQFYNSTTKYPSSYDKPDANYIANEVYFDHNANNISFKPLHIETEDKSKVLVDIMSEENKTKLNVTDNKEEKQKIRRQ